MAFDGFLYIEGQKGHLKGECKDKDHAEWIDIMSFSYSVTQSQSVDTGGGLSAGKAQLGDFTFTQKYHKGSPALWGICASGEHLKKVEFNARKSAGDNQMMYLKVVFTDCIITNISTSGGSDNEIPDETVGIAYTEVEFSYQEQDEKTGGKKGGAVNAKYNRKTNKRG
jgi:type VI secretion system secreted protein Hcp